MLTTERMIQLDNHHLVSTKVTIVSFKNDKDIEAKGKSMIETGCSHSLKISHQSDLLITEGKIVIL